MCPRGGPGDAGFGVAWPCSHAWYVVDGRNGLTIQLFIHVHLSFSRQTLVLRTL